MTTIYRYLLAALAIIFLFGGTWYIGYTKGKQSAEKQYLSQQIKQLQTVINDTKTATQKAQEASTHYERLVSAKAEADIKTTKEFYNALKTTKTTRTQCVFDDHIMQQLDIARRRASDATHTTQANGILSTTRGNER